MSENNIAFLFVKKLVYPLTSQNPARSIDGSGPGYLGKLGKEVSRVLLLCLCFANTVVWSAPIPGISPACYLRPDGTEDTDFKDLYRLETSINSYQYCTAVQEGEDLSTFVSQAKDKTLIMIKGHFELSQSMEVPEGVTVSSLDTCSAHISGKDSFSGDQLVLLNSRSRLAGVTLDPGISNSLPSVINTINCPGQVSVDGNVITGRKARNVINIRCNNPTQGESLRFKGSQVKNNWIAVGAPAYEAIELSHYGLLYHDRYAATLENNYIDMKQATSTGVGIKLFGHGSWLVSGNTIDYSGVSAGAGNNQLLEKLGRGIDFDDPNFNAKPADIPSSLSTTPGVTVMADNAVKTALNTTGICNLYLKDSRFVRLSDNDLSGLNGLCYEGSCAVESGSDNNNWGNVINQCRTRDHQSTLAGAVCDHQGHCCPLGSTMTSATSSPSRPPAGARLPYHVRAVCPTMPPSTLPPTTLPITNATTMEVTTNTSSSESTLSTETGYESSGFGLKAGIGTIIGGFQLVSGAIIVLLVYTRAINKDRLTRGGDANQ